MAFPQALIDVWTEEALEALKGVLEANPSVPSTETAAWRAGFVRGWQASNEAAVQRTLDAADAPPQASER